MSDKLTVTIVGSNGVSRVFQEVTNDAQKMGQSVQRASQTAGQASTQMGQQVEQSAQLSSASYEKIGNAIGRIGLAFGAFTLLAGKAAGDSEASAARLETSFQNAGLAIDDYQGRIDQLNATGLHLAFDDEDVQDALSRLVTSTGDAEQAFKDVGLAEDIARAQGISLASATNVVVQAEAGRFRGLSLLGIALDDTATKQDYLAAAQAKFAGQADAYATTGAANFDRWKNAAENALESVGGKLEGIQVPILALSSAATALGPLGGAIKGVAAEISLAEVGTGALSLALGPVGLAAGAAVAAGGIAILIKDMLDYKPAADSAADATLNLQNLLYTMAGQGGASNLITPLKDVSDAWSLLAKTAAENFDRYGAIQSDLVDLNSKMQQEIANGQFEQADATKAQIDAMNAQADALANLKLSGSDIDKITADIEDLFRKPGIDAKQAAADIQYYFDLFRQGSIDEQTLVKYLDESATNWTKYSTAVINNSSVLSENAQITYQHTKARRDGMAAEADAKYAIDASTESYKKQTDAIDDLARSHKALTDPNDQTRSFLNQPQHNDPGFAPSIDQNTQAAETAIPAIAGFTDAMDDMIAKSQAADQALHDQLGGYYDLVQGIYTADSAQAAFKATQDGLIGSEGVYNQQLSEYTGQLNSLKGAYDIIQGKQADGIALSQQELDFLAKYPDAYERLTGGQEDATEAAGMLALQYAENMKAGDELNRSMQDQTNSVGDLVDEVKALIDVLLGVPPDVKSDIHVDGLDYANTQVSFLRSQLDALNGLSVTSYATVVNSSTGASNFFNKDAPPAGRLGGVMGYANGGVVARLAEPGPELLHYANGGMGMALTDGLYNIPRGTYVDTAPVTKQKMAGMNAVTIAHATFNFYGFQTQDQVRQQINEFMIGSAR